jgi:hypothetical protein
MDSIKTILERIGDNRVTQAIQSNRFEQRAVSSQQNTSSISLDLVSACDKCSDKQTTSRCISVCFGLQTESTTPLAPSKETIAKLCKQTKASVFWYDKDNGLIFSRCKSNATDAYVSLNFENANRYTLQQARDMLVSHNIFSEEFLEKMFSAKEIKEIVKEKDKTPQKLKKDNIALLVKDVIHDGAH